MYRPYNVNMSDGWCCVKFLEGEFDYYFLEFHINGVLADGCYKILLAEDGLSVKFKRAINKLCFASSEEHHGGQVFGLPFSCHRG